MNAQAYNRKSEHNKLNADPDRTATCTPNPDGGKKSQFCLADDEVHEMQSLKKLMSSHIQTRDRMKSYMFPEEEIEKLREKNPTIKNKDKKNSSGT
jgi:hypothetical protein